MDGLIHQSSAVTLPCAAPCSAVIVVIAVTPTDVDRAVGDLAELAGGDILPEYVNDRKISVYMSHRDLPAGRTGQIVYLPCFAVRHGHGLLEKQVASVLHGILCNLEMQS